MSEYQTSPHELEWDDQITDDDEQYIILDEGDYDFTVTAFERSRFPGSAKIPACKKAVFTLAVETPEGTANTKFDLILWSTLKWKIHTFFRAIGQTTSGEAFSPRWNQVVGSKGRAHFKPRAYEKNGETKFVNAVTTFYDSKGEAPQTAAPDSKPTWQGGKF